ncbi:DUF3667 domain-containing protein [Sphingomonas sp. 1P06PA]|uniref:DUF3667 domain-containing protein n=1 Tax=Sphingomonas sp. 1P06PA TaxID=554121 RepID=UPI0039A435F5
MDGDAIGELGAIATAGMAARAIEPGAGEAHAAGHGACLNCGCKLDGAYCPCCGQAAHVHRSLAAFGHDIAHSVLHFEGKIFRTLPLLFFRPGELTRRYVHGERAKFVSPMALFLFSVFTMFAVFSLVGGPVPLASGEEIRQGVAQARVNIAAEQRNLSSQRDRIDREIAAARAANRPTTALEMSRKAFDAKIADTQRSDAFVRLGETGTSALRPNMEELKINTGDPAFDRKLGHLLENPDLALYKLQSSAYKFSWALIPISVPFIWLMFFWKRGLTVYDHAVFATYSISFVTLLVILLSLIRPIGLGAGFALTVLTFVPPVHMFVQLRGAYPIGRFGALWRTVYLVTVATFSSLAFFASLLAIGLLG